MKQYSIFTIPTDVQPKQYALEWLRKVLGYQNSPYTELDYDMRVKNGNGYKVEFTLKHLTKGDIKGKPN